jgi:hypothetical protein
MSADRMVYIRMGGEPGCMTAKDTVKFPAEFERNLKALADDLSLALDCVAIFGGIPIPLAKAILRNIEPVTAALDLAIKSQRKEAPDEHREIHIAG